MRLYINGVEDITQAQTGAVVANASFELGQSFDANRDLDGHLDEFRVWNIARTATEIANSMDTELSGNEADLVVYYKFDDTPATCEIQDCSPNANHGVRGGTGGANNLPQYDPDIPAGIANVACGNPCDPPPPSCGDSFGPECYSATSTLIPIAIDLCPNPGQTIQINFTAGQVENTFDEVQVFCGSQGSGSNGMQIYNAYGTGGDLTGLTLTCPLVDQCISVYINSNGSVTCASNGFTPIELTASCVAAPCDETDTQPPVITCPPGQTLTCFESVPASITNIDDFIAQGGTVSDNCPVVSEDYTVFGQNDSNERTNCPGDGLVVVRTYFVQDRAGNVSSCTQTFTYLESTVGPVITEILPTCYKYCASLANPMASDITYDTDCAFGATVTINDPIQIGPDNCPGTIYRYTYIVTDDCGRTSAPVTRDFIIGNDGPTIECTPFNLILECGDPDNQSYIDEHLSQISVNTSCELGYTLNHFPQNFNMIACGSSTVVTFIATDACGRTASCTTTVAIQDNTAPVITSTYVDGICNEAVCGSNLSFWFTRLVRA